MRLGLHTSSAFVVATAALAMTAGPASPQAPSPNVEARPVFVDVTRAAGLRWGIDRIATRGFNLVETMGGGGGFVDYDGDGLLDIYLVSYSREPQSGGRPAEDALYRNNGDGTFTDVTAKAGIQGGMRGMGLAVGDYDNDGRPDLYVSGYGAHHLWHNNGDGTFTDVTARAGLDPPPRWGTSAAFFDYDGDGLLDLYVASYLTFEPEGTFPCDLIADRPFCSIDRFRGSSGVLYRNNGDGTFTDVTARAGVSRPGAKGLGVVAADLDNDGRVDLFQANDTAPNGLFRNRGDGTFAEVALEAEVAFDPSGRALGAMGVDVDDQDGDGFLDLFVTNFSNQANQLFRNNRDGTFRDVAGALGLAAVSLPMSGFGARFLDYDDDGRVDLVVANGHPFAPVARVWPGVTYAEPMFLFENEGSAYREVAADRGSALARPYLGRGLATGDYDNDGDPDLLLLCAGEAPRLLRNDGGNRRHWLGVALQGTTSNRDAVGARVTVTAGGRARTRVRAGGTSYLSASDPRLLFGLGSETRVERLEVRWPTGRVERFPEPAVDRYLTLKEGAGRIDARS